MDVPLPLTQAPSAPDIAGVVLAGLALLVSAVALWHTLSARPRIKVSAHRLHRAAAGRAIARGDEVLVYNTGRASAIISSVEALGIGGLFISEATVRGGSASTLPASLKAGEVMRLTFDVPHGADKAGTEHGYVVEYLAPRDRRIRLVAKVTESRRA